MDKQSTLYQLMGMRMNGIMNGITQRDEDYFLASNRHTWRAIWNKQKGRTLPSN